MSLHFCHVFPTFDAGGLEVRATQIMRLIGPSVRHTIVAMDDRMGCLEQVDPSVQLEVLLAPQPQNVMSTPMQMAELLKRVQPDLLLSYNWGSIESIAGAKLAKLDAMIHHEDGFGREETESVLVRRVLARRALLASVRALVVPSRQLETLAKERWKQPHDRVHYLPNGVDLARFAPSKRPGGGELVIGHVGRFRPEKNQARLIRLFAESSLRQNARLVFAGDGPLIEDAQGLARSLGVADRIRFLGAVSDVPAVYRSIDLFALCSTTEQMPLSVLEAMASGLPVVSTDVGDVADMVSSANRDFVVPESEDSALLFALETLVAEPERRAELGSANRVHAVATFAIERCLARHAELYLREARSPLTRRV